MRFASAATRFARQEAREWRIQAAQIKRCLYPPLSCFMVAGQRPAAADALVAYPAGAVAPAGLVVLPCTFGSSFLRIFDLAVGAFSVTVAVVEKLIQVVVEVTWG